MIFSLLLLFVMLLLISAAIFYLFCFFLPALKMKYDGISSSLATELKFTGEVREELNKDFSKIASIVEDEHSGLDKRLVYKGDKNCRLFHDIYGSEYSTSRICLGFGDCVLVCPQKAISIRNNKAHVSEFCNACGKCLDYCPVNIISLVPRVKKSEEVGKKGFKFWAACYKLISGGARVH